MWEHDSSFDAYTNRSMELFYKLSQIPRVSGNEAGIRDYLVDWAQSHNFESAIDVAGNLIIYIPASKGQEEKAPIILQGHMDMVGEKTPDSPHQFDRDPIPVYRDGDHLRAKGTTLGADNGIAIAIAQMLAEQNSLAHPPLELCFTVEEETGLDGASKLDPKLLKSNILINIDSEDEGVITIGCAGGMDSSIQLPIKRSATPELALGSEHQPDTDIAPQLASDPATAPQPQTNNNLHILQLGGLLGGHSGVEIHKIRANALQILARVLYAAQKNQFSIHVYGIQGGNAHNAIPREASALLQCEPEQTKYLKELIQNCQENIRQEFLPEEENLQIQLFTLEMAPDHLQSYYKQQNQEAPIEQESLKKVIHLLLALPHGVEKYSGAIPGLVETSSNIAAAHTHSNYLHILCSQRSSVPSGLIAITDRIDACCLLAGASCNHGEPYPPWKPDIHSLLLARAKKAYSQLFGKEPIVESIHAGLECGIIGEKLQNAQMISIGPTIQHPHSPEEQLHIPSLQKTISFLVQILADYCET